MGNALVDSGVIISYGGSIYDEAKMRLGNKLRIYRTEEFNTSVVDILQPPRAWITSN